MNARPEEESLAAGDLTGGESRAPRKLTDLHKTITMAQIAKAAGVSQGAISSLLNDRDYGIRVSEKTRERVFKVCREMGYIPNDLRAVVRMYPDLGDLALLVTTRRSAGLADPLVARVAAGAMTAATESSRSITIGCYDEATDYLPDPESLPHPVRSGVASKFMLFGPPNVSLFQALTKRGSPAICLGYEVRSSGVLSLLPDYQLASRLALEHLFKLGHRRVAIVSGPFGATDSQIIELNRGVRIAFEQSGFPMETQNVLYGELSREAGASAFESFAAREPQPTAVFCMSDASAAGVIAAAQSRGRKVPGDLSVIGCSDDLVAQFTFPPLTTVHIPAEEMAIQGVHEIERLVRDEILHEQKRHLLPVRLVERSSCGPPGDS